MAAPPPPSYNQSYNYGYNPQVGPVQVEQGQSYHRVPTNEPEGYPPQNPAYPPVQGGGGYPPQGNDPAYPPPGQGMYPPPAGPGFGTVPSFPMPPPRAFPHQEGGAGGANVGIQEGGQPKPEGDEAPWEDGAGWAGNSFSDKAIRMAFIRKVYLILMCQLMFTAGIVLFFVLHAPTKRWVQAHSWIYWPSYGIFLVTYIVLVCCPSVRRKWPVNFICLGIFTMALTYMAGMISSSYNTESVAIAMGITAGVSLAVSLFSCQTKWDFTKCGGVLFAGSIALMLFGLVCIIWYATMGPSRILQCVYGGVAALLFSMFLAYDTQMLIGGRKYELSPEDHIFGALQLYLDIVYLFIIFLSLFGGSD